MIINQIVAKSGGEKNSARRKAAGWRKKKGGAATEKAKISAMALERENICGENCSSAGAARRRKMAYTSAASALQQAAK